MNTLAGRYEIIRQIGSGGFGVTFLARDNLQPSKPLCVVKQLRSNQSNPRVIEFFEKEAAILERLGKHPQIPQSLAHFSENQNLYIVQEFIEGQDLSREIFPGKQLSEGDVTKLLQDVLEILSFVHSQGVIHRDIKPKNLMRRQQDGRIFLIDFGSVKELSSLMLNTEGEVKPSVVVVGTPGYMPNEQRNNLGTQKDLQDYQRRLELRDEDIAAVDALVPTLLEPQSESSKTASSPDIQTQTFQFDTATLTVKSSGFLGIRKKTYEINRSQGRAEFFTEDLCNGVVIEMVAILGGKFLMGSPDNEPERSSYESPQHTVTIQPFFMGKFPVTQAQWKAVAALGKVNIDLNLDPSNFKGANRPVEQVSWDEVIEFCDRLSKKTGKTYRLPSEAEWEYACRAGTTTPFYFGETITTDLANYNGNYTYGSAPKGEYRQQTTTVVGKFPPNPFGLFDMCGNVWEWCRDQWHENYNNAPTDGSARLGDNRHCVWRSSSWEDKPRLCRSAARSYGTRGYRYPNAGFRVVCGA